MKSIRRAAERFLRALRRPQIVHYHLNLPRSEMTAETTWRLTADTEELSERSEREGGWV